MVIHYSNLRYKFYLSLLAAISNMNMHRFVLIQIEEKPYSKDV